MLVSEVLTLAFAMCLTKVTVSLATSPHVSNMCHIHSSFNV